MISIDHNKAYATCFSDMYIIPPFNIFDSFDRYLNENEAYKYAKDCHLCNSAQGMTIHEPYTTNSYYRYLLVSIHIFTRKAFVVPLKTKNILRY